MSQNSSVFQPAFRSIFCGPQRMPTKTNDDKWIPFMHLYVSHTFKLFFSQSVVWPAIIFCSTSACPSWLNQNNRSIWGRCFWCPLPFVFSALQHTFMQPNIIIVIHLFLFIDTLNSRWLCHSREICSMHIVLLFGVKLPPKNPTSLWYYMKQTPSLSTICPIYFSVLRGTGGTCYASRTGETPLLLPLMRCISEYRALSVAWCPLVLYDQRCASALPVHVSAWLFIFPSLCLPNQSLWGNTGSGPDDKLKQLSVVITRRMKKDVNEVEQQQKKRAPAWKRDKMPELL